MNIKYTNPHAKRDQKTNHMKKVILMAACLIVASSAINAQETPKKTKVESHKGGQKGAHGKKTSEERAKKHVDELNSEVTLTEEQKVKINDLALDKVKKSDEIRTKYRGQEENKEVMKKEITAVRKEYVKNLKAVLTKDQIEKLEAKHKEKKAAGKPNALDQD